MVATFWAFVAIYSGPFFVALFAEIIANVGVLLNGARSIQRNKLPKSAITGVCGNLFGNQFKKPWGF
jgi:hypothetical protein